MPTKVVVIGLDGATFDLILPWAKAGHLPNIHRLMQRGTCGTLTSTFPPLTGPAWSSFMTGKSPGAHGILEFFRRKEGSYRQVLNSRLDIDGKSLWGLLSEYGKTMGVMGIPLTYPPEPINGFLITGLLTPHGKRDFSTPVKLIDEIEEKFGPYRLQHNEKYRPGNPYPFIHEQFEILENNTQVALHLLKEKPWDLFVLHLLGTDRIQHEFWHLIDPKHPNHDPDEREQLGNIVLDFYQEIDASLGLIIDHLNKDTVVILMSDHGFGPVYKFINFNTWLIKEGYLVIKKNLGTRIRHLLFKLGFNYKVLGQLILKLGLGKSAKKLGRANRESWQRRLFLSLDDVDWTKSRVYSIGNFGQMFINLKGREPHGVVAPGEEYELVITDLKTRLKMLKDPETGESVITEIHRGDEIYSGPYTERFPDLIFMTRNMEYKSMGLSDFSSARVFDPVFGTTGHHRMNGILICFGPSIFQENSNVDGAKIEDLAPTILYMLDQAIPSVMDGKVLLDLFTKEFNDTHNISFTNQDHIDMIKDKETLTEEEEAEIASRLRTLGYVN